MPYVLTYNKSFIETRIVSICDYLGLNKNFESFINWILNLRKQINIPHKISDIIDVKKLNIEELSKMAFEDPSTSSNPRKLSIEDMKILYEKSISGELF